MIFNRNDPTVSSHHETQTEELKRLITIVMKQGINRRETGQKQTTSQDQLIIQFQQNRIKMEEQIIQLKQENNSLKRQLAQQKQKHTDIITHNNTQFNSKRYHTEQIETLLPIQKQYHTPVTLRSPIHQLGDESNSQFNSDQLCRLNSYLIEHNSTIKLLLQKMNYLLKLRGLSHPSLEEEIEVINKTKILLKQNKVIDEAQSVMRSSMKKYFESDGSSDIEEEDNGLYP